MRCTEIQDMMNDLVGIMRVEADMKKALVELDQFAERVQRVSVSGGRTYNAGWHMAMDLRHILHVSRALTTAAIARRESRGGHARSDFPNYDPHFAEVNLLVKNVDGAAQVVELPRPEMPAELKELLKEA